MDVEEVIRDLISDAIMDGLEGDSGINEWCGCGSINKATAAVLETLMKNNLIMFAVKHEYGEKWPDGSVRSVWQSPPPSLSSEENWLVRRAVSDWENA